MLSLALLGCVFCALLVWIKYVRDKSSIPLPPAVPGKLPIIGHAHKLFKYITDLQGLLDYVAEDCKKQGGVTHFYFGSELYYLILDPQDAFTAANICLKKHYAFGFGKIWMGDGLIISSGEIWKRHRKLVTPAFTLPVIHGFLDVFNSQSKKLASCMEAHVGKGYFNQYPYLKINALESLCIGTFGIDPIDDKEFTQKYMESVEILVNIMFDKLLKFWLQNDFICRLSGLKKKEEKAVENLHAMANAVLQKKKNTMKRENLITESETNGRKYKPFLDLLFELSKNGAITDREIREELDTIIVAGFETTSNQLTFTLLQLGAHPAVQDKLYNEILQVLGPDADVEKDDVNKLVYTNAVIMESLRMIPSVPLLAREVNNDVRLSRTYAMISMKVTLAHLLRKYRVKADMSKLKKKYEFVMRPVSGHEISLERRT